MFGGGNGANQRGEEVWDEIMAEVDKNNDGVIDFAEFTSGLRS